MACLAGNENCTCSEASMTFCKKCGKLIQSRCTRCGKIIEERRRGCGSHYAYSKTQNKRMHGTNWGARTHPSLYRVSWSLGGKYHMNNISNSFLKLITICLCFLLVFVYFRQSYADEPPCQVTVSASQDKGYASGKATLYQKREWEEAGLKKVDWSHVKEYSLHQGTTTFRVIPGTYKVRFQPSSGTSEASDIFSLSGTQTKRKNGVRKMGSSLLLTQRKNGVRSEKWGQVYY